MVSFLKQLFKPKSNIAKLRAKGMRIGENCRIYTKITSTEPYLITLGNNVSLAGGVQLLTHDGSMQLFRNKYPNRQMFGKITIGDNTFIGQNAIITCNTEIGANCIIGAGSVVRGTIPDNSVVMGNPAEVVMRTEMVEHLFLSSPNCLETLHLPHEKRKEALKKHFGIS
jgi:acetyltransferase-like isoleucine patch superfamily enzyme